jgi:NAD(P)-dependent dehydrogenase (short-subunit alcohol dehydrogenase family)
VGSRRTVLITGCSSPQGIGFASARALAAAGHAVHATVRDHTHDRELLAGLDGELLIHDLDLLDRATFAPVIEAVLEADGSLDVLVNNAGYGLIGALEQVDLDRARANFETNFFGTVALIQEVLPLFRKQRRGHIINVSTIFAAGLCVPAIGYYVASKAALETVCQALALEAAPWGVRVTNFQPGPVMTDLSREWGSRLEERDDPRPSVSDELYGWVLADGSPEPQSADEVAEALVGIVASEAPPLAEQSGAASRAYAGAALRDPTRQSELEPLLAEFARSFAGAPPPGAQSPSS